jgi:epoxyqueuosine reductase
VVCAINYNTDNPYSTQVHDPSCGWISRYAWSRNDYHDAVLRRLKQVEAALRQAVPAELQPNLTTRSYVDTGPVVERVYAKYAGVGWLGKILCLINQKKGSWLFWSDSHIFGAHARPARSRPLRYVHRCIDACPTDAPSSIHTGSIPTNAFPISPSKARYDP